MTPTVGSLRKDPSPLLTAQALLELFMLSSDEKVTPSTQSQSRSERMAVLRLWQGLQPTQLSALLVSTDGVDGKSGCHPLHWAAGTGFDEAVAFLLDHTQHPSITDDEHPPPLPLSVDQRAQKPSTGRTPLHYAARNGHLSTCRLLIEQYGADPCANCQKGSVTPLQLAVWQNQLEVVQYLVQRINHGDSPGGDSDGEIGSGSVNNAILERNDFSCGLNHWIGLVPKHRWLSCDGKGVLPLARYLHHKAGVAFFSSTVDNQQKQGHTPLHKAAWGGNIRLIEYYCKEHGVLDTVQDTCGNYAADLALMRGHQDANQWLLRFASGERQRSCEILGVSPVGYTKQEIQVRYKELARKFHPDKRQQERRSVGSQHVRDGRDLGSSLEGNGEDNDNDDTFVRIRAAYEHLMFHDGVGSQRNPKHESLRLLTGAPFSNKSRDIATSDWQKNDFAKADGSGNNDDLFAARILAVVSDYGEKGFPISCITKRWNQIWPHHPFPTPEQYIIEVPVTVSDVPGFHNAKADDRRKMGHSTTTPLPSTPMTILVSRRVNLLKYLKWKCGSVVRFRKIGGVELAFKKKATSSSFSAGKKERTIVFS